MWSRRAACESMTTRRRFLPGPFRRGGRRRRPVRRAWKQHRSWGLAPLRAARFAFAGAFAFGGGLRGRSRWPRPPSPEPFSAARASDSSTLDWAALASTPAAFSAASSSLLVSALGLGDLVTRFFAISVFCSSPPRSPARFPRPLRPSLRRGTASAPRTPRRAPPRVSGSSSWLGAPRLVPSGLVLPLLVGLGDASGAASSASRPPRLVRASSSAGLGLLGSSAAGSSASASRRTGLGPLDDRLDGGVVRLAVGERRDLPRRLRGPAPRPDWCEAGERLMLGQAAVTGSPGGPRSGSGGPSTTPPCSGRRRPPRPRTRCPPPRWANSVSDLMSTRQPVSRAARRAFCPSRPIASESWSSGTITVAWPASSSTRTSRTRAGESALATKRAGSSL